MTVGTSIFLIVVGAILSYAVTWEVPAVDLEAVGVILVLAGVLGLAISLAWTFHPSRRAACEDEPPAPDGPAGTYTVPYEAGYGTSSEAPYGEVPTRTHFGARPGSSAEPPTQPQLWPMGYPDLPYPDLPYPDDDRPAAGGPASAPWRPAGGSGEPPAPR